MASVVVVVVVAVVVVVVAVVVVVGPQSAVRSSIIRSIRKPRIHKRRLTLWKCLEGPKNSTPDNEEYAGVKPSEIQDISLWIDHTL